MDPEKIGPYRILDKLGSGGMGHVYLGEHETTGVKAAVKVLSASLAREGGFVERFNREIDAMRKLDNPHIVKLFDSGTEGENYYYAMEYVEGETLMQVMRRERRIPWTRTLHMAVEICRALKAAHDHGIIHRDLKPSNLLVAKDGMIKLTDFGVAQVFAANRLTVTGGIIGTAEYMSPEQAQGKRASKQSDLYSLGAVMYAMITGRTPFSGSTAVEVIQKHKFGLFDRPSLIVDDLPQRVEDTICRLLEKDPAKRFPDALVLLKHLEQIERLEEFASRGVTLVDASNAGQLSTDREAPTVAATGSGRPVPAGEPGRPGPATLMQGLMRAEIDEMSRPHPVLAALNSTWGLVLMLALVAGGGIWWFQSRAVSPEERFAQGVALLEQEPGREWSRARREFFEPLLASDPQTWRERVTPYLSKIELYELTRTARGARRSTAALENEPERLLQLAAHYRQIGDRTRAEAILTSLTALVEGDDAQTRVAELAARLRDELRGDESTRQARDEWLRASLARAEKLSAEGHTAQARALWQAIVDLYGTDTSAADLVTKARVALGPESRP